jgi:hypothetical protein
METKFEETSNLVSLMANVRNQQLLVNLLENYFYAKTQSKEEFYYADG